MNQIKKKIIKAGVIGLGVGAHQARTISAHPDCQLVWICDLNSERLSEIGSELTEAKQTLDDQDIFNDPDIDLICIASYDEFHYRQVISALNNGKHVYVEKPICLKKNEIQDIHKILKANSNLQLSSNMVLRTCPLFNKVREALRSQKMGAIYYLEADYFWGRKEKMVSGWRAETDFYSIVHGAAVHMIDLALWITGKKPISVQAIGSRIVAADTPQMHNDFAVLLLKFKDQMSVKISAHGGCVHPHFHSLKVFGKNTSFIHDSTGTVWVDSSNPKQVFRSERAEYPAKIMRSEALISFVNSLLSFDQNVLVPSEDVFNVMNICLAAELAINSGQTETIEYL